MKKQIFILTSFLSWFFSNTVFASSNNLYEGVAHFLGLDPVYSACLASFCILLLTVLIGVYFKAKSKQILDSSYEHSPKIFLILEGVMDFVYNLCKEQCGPHYKDYLLFLTSLFLFILFNNLSGLVPGLTPVTSSFNANLALGFIVFITYNYAGIKEHGFKYIKQFMGPFLILAPLFLVLETISHLARPISLSFRLAANLFGDHLLLGVFSQMIPFGVPVALMFFGLLVACIQSFVFTVLSGIYIGMAVSHDH